MEDFIAVMNQDWRGSGEYIVRVKVVNREIAHVGLTRPNSDFGHDGGLARGGAEMVTRLEVAGVGPGTGGGVVERVVGGGVDDAVTGGRVDGDVHQVGVVVEVQLLDR